MRRPLLFVLLTAAHLALTVALLLFVFGGGMARFDTGGQPGWFEAACGRLLSVLAFPLLTLVEGRMGQLFRGRGDTRRLSPTARSGLRPALGSSEL
jgi:hypothetical protein